MTEALLTMLSMESPPTLRSTVYSENGVPVQAAIARPPDINLPLAVDIGEPHSWPSSKPTDILNVALVTEIPDARSLIPSKSKKLVKRGDSIWGAWFFFNHYFRPALTDNMGLRLNCFVVQHDMENMYMWVFKDRSENALGKMQLRSYMNGHARFGEQQFPFSADKGFARSHRMQRKRYRGLSNPQCLHGIEVVRSPNLSLITETDLKRWVELTGRDLNFILSVEADDFSIWRTLPRTEIDLDRRDLCFMSRCSNSSTKKQASPKSIGIASEWGVSTLDLSCKLMGHTGGSSNNDFALKVNHVSDIAGGNDEDLCTVNGSLSGDMLGEEIQQIEHPHWVADSSGVILDASGPVTAAKSIYEDEQGYLIMVSLPFTDMKRLRVSWRNTVMHGVVKVQCTSTARLPAVTRGQRTFKLTDQNPEHCPQGEFVREIHLATRIPEDAELQAVYVEASAGLEIIVPKYSQCSEEREVRVFLPP